MSEIGTIREAPAAMERHLTPTRHGYVHSRSWGSGDAALILLHMGPLSGRMFERIGPLLAAGRRVVAIDRIGYGASDALRRPLAFVEYAEATVDAIDALGIGTFDVFGVHTGSSEALCLASTLGKRIRRVAVMGLIAFGDGEREAFLNRPGTNGTPAVATDGAHLLSMWRRWTGWRVDGWSDEDLERAVEQEIASFPRSAWTVPEVFRFPTVKVLRAIAQPLLIIMPTDYLWESTRGALESAPPGTRVVEIAMSPRTAAPTGLFDTMPASLARTIGAFLDVR